MHCRKHTICPIRKHHSLVVVSIRVTPLAYLRAGIVLKKGRVLEVEHEPVDHRDGDAAYVSW